MKNSVLLVLLSLLACKPDRIRVQPNDVRTLQVRRFDGATRFCPGEIIQVEMVADLKDGTVCSNLRPNTGCRKQKHAVLDPRSVALFAEPARWVSDREFRLQTPPNPFATWRDGVELRGWIQSTGTKYPLRTEQVNRRLLPTYLCHSAHPQVFSDGQAPTGRVGRRGPNLTVLLTPLPSPFYPDVVLLKVVSGSQVRYFISQDAGHPVTIVSQGQGGGNGSDGQSGRRGSDGRSAVSECENGDNGDNGDDGGDGGPGAPGGPGGDVLVVFDQTKVQALERRVIARSEGGPGGHGGRGGSGGAGGSGGSGRSGTNCSGSSGSSGSYGRSGHDGPTGPHGPRGHVTATRGLRDEMFAPELPTFKELDTHLGL
jgi:hypothetical protein